MAKIYIISKYPIFVKPIAYELKQEGHEIVMTNQFYPFCVEKADTIYCNWMDENALKIQEIPMRAKKVLKCHSYEAFTGIKSNIKWSRWDEVIFVNDHIRQVVDPPKNKYTIIPNGVKVDDYRYTEANTKKIAYLGYWSRKKGIGLLDFLTNSLPEYEFHLGGRFQERDVQEFIKTNRKIHLHGWIKDKSKFFRDKRYVINTSMRESQCVGLMEGMACGCKPLVRNWIGASSMYKEEWTYNSFKQLKSLLEGECEPRKYRQFIKANYDFDKHYERVKGLLL